MTLKSRHFVGHTQLAKFVNDNAIATANIQQIIFDAASGQYVLFYWS